MHSDQRYATISQRLLLTPLGEWVAIDGAWWFIAFDKQTPQGETVKVHRGLYDASGHRYQLWARVSPDMTIVYGITFQPALPAP